MIWLRMLRPYRGRLAVLFPAVVLGVCATLSAPLVLRLLKRTLSAGAKPVFDAPGGGNYAVTTLPGPMASLA